MPGEFSAPTTQVAVHGVEIENIKEDVAEIKDTLKDYNENSKKAYKEFQCKHNTIHQGQIEIKSKLDGILEVKKDVKENSKRIGRLEKFGIVVAGGAGGAASWVKSLFIS